MWKLNSLNSKQQWENKFAKSINLIFGGYVKTKITCLECKNKSITYKSNDGFYVRHHAKC